MRRALKRLGLLTGGLVLGLLLAELVLRTWFLEPGVMAYAGSLGGRQEQMYVPDARVARLPRAGADIRVVGVEETIRLRFNQLGLRGPELGPRTGPRWLVIGDSFTLAVQVAEEDTFSARLAHKLGIEVLNGGVDAYQTWQEIARYEALDAAVSADTVLMVLFLGNDLLGTAHGRLIEPLDSPAAAAAAPAAPAPPPRGKRRVAPGAPPPPLAALSTTISSRSALLAWLQITYKRASLSRGRDPDLKQLMAELELYTRGGAVRLATFMTATERALSHLQATTRSHDDRLMVAVAPPVYTMTEEALLTRMTSFSMTDPDIDAPRRAVVEALAKLEIPTCDLTDPLRAAVAQGRQPYLKYDAHWSADGHAVVADALADCAATLPALGTADIELRK